MKTSLVPAILIVGVALSSCSRVEPMSPLEITEIARSEVILSLQQQRADRDTLQLIEKNLSTVYSHVTIRRYDESGTMHLLIDQFSFDEWSNPKTGEAGTAPHGTRMHFVRTSDGWTGTSVTHYGG